MAKDGHIIVGPYNEDGELWECIERDLCNGVFLSDNSYAYAMTWTYPYVVGCWGPGAEVYVKSQVHDGHDLKFAAQSARREPCKATQ